MEANSIILHCSDTEDSGTVSWSAIRRYHMRTLNWSDIGYHFGIEQIGGDIVILRGRKPTVKGAHCSAGGYNSKSLGVCVVGKYDIESPSDHVLAATVDLLTKICFVFGIQSNNVLAHSEVDDKKTCPGLMWNMARIRSQLHRNVVCGGVHNLEDINVIAEYSGDRIYWR